ncbi:unnamed protein product [Closterium sp. NIES-53]
MRCYAALLLTAHPWAPQWGVTAGTHVPQWGAVHVAAGGTSGGQRAGRRANDVPRTPHPFCPSLPPLPTPCPCVFPFAAIAEGDEQVRQDAVRITGLQLAAGAAAEEQKRQAAMLADRMLHTIYMGTENSSQATRARAKQLASEIGAWHVDTSIDSVVAAVVVLFLTVTGLRPQYKVGPPGLLSLQSPSVH